MRMCLIGEADPFIAHLLRRFAEESGLYAVRADVGQGILGLARQFAPEIIILDPDLPGKTRGWEAAAALKGDPDLCLTPIITCSWDGATEAHARLSGAAGHLQKPNLHYDDFVAALRGVGAVIGPRLAYLEPASRADETDGARNGGV